MNSEIQIFNRDLCRSTRARIVPNFKDHSFLYDWSYRDIAERLSDISKEFMSVLEIGANSDAFIKQFFPKAKLSVTTDNCNSMFTDDNHRVVADEEFLPFADESFDLVVSVLNLHTVNDLPGALVQIRRLLKKDGLLLASFFGPETLKELRQAMLHTELELRIGVSPHVYPFAGVKDLGALLQRAGFSMPVVDSEVMPVDYSNNDKLLRDLQGMGQNNVLLRKSNKYLGKRFFELLRKNYAKKYNNRASFEIINITGMG
jgi:NADH dehydrogenase [ubiquinone] 1 alpha subcomplex assembly factor 5